MNTLPYSMLIISTLLVALNGAGAQAGSARRDTIDVSVGSPLVSTARLVAHQTHALSSRVAAGTTTPGADATWTISFLDSAGTSYLHVESGAGGRTTSDFIFDRSTLALLKLNGAPPQLPSPAFLGGLADLLAESLPRRTGVVYRANLWRRGMNASEATLFETTNRETVDILGKQYRDAWVVEERTANDGRLVGRMWLVEGAPYLVRWMIFNPDGSATQLDQELVTAPRRQGAASLGMFDPKSSTLAARTELPLELTPDGRAIVSVKIDGRGPFRLASTSRRPPIRRRRTSMARDT